MPSSPAEPEHTDTDLNDAVRAGRVWTAPRFRLHEVDPRGGRNLRTGEASGYASYRPS